MLLIENITTNPLQQRTVVLPSGLTFNMTMYYVPLQNGWFITNLTYNKTTFVLNSLRITVNPNMLYAYQNIIPFGLACFSTNSREPTEIQDFASGAARLYIMTQQQVQQYTTYIQGGALPS